MISVNTPYFIGSFVGMILNLVIPYKEDDPENVAAEKTWANEYEAEEEGGLELDEAILIDGKDTKDKEDEDERSGRWWFAKKTRRYCLTVNEQSDFWLKVLEFNVCSV